MKKILKELMAGANVTAENLANAVNCSPATIHAILRGGLKPSLELTISIADFFALPMDFLCGRLSEEKAQKMLDNYGAYFMLLRRAPYESYLFGKHLDRLSLKNKVVEPWPYNLLSAAYTEWSDILTKEQEEGLDFVLNLLPEQQRSYLLLHFQEGMTLRAIQKKVQTGSVEHVRIEVQKALYALRRPSIRKIIVLGVDGANKASQLSAELLALKEKETEIFSIEKLLAEREKELRITAEQRAVMQKKISELGLSARAENVLLRGKCTTCADLVRMVQTGELRKLRSCGVKTETEILNCLLQLGLSN